MRGYNDVLLLATRAFACHDLMAWLKLTDWHYALRLKCDVLVHGVNRHPVEVGKLYPPVKAKLFTRAFRGVGLPTQPASQASFVGEASPTDVSARKRRLHLWACGQMEFIVPT